jgi:hypothetical protein
VRTFELVHEPSHCHIFSIFLTVFMMTLSHDLPAAALDGLAQLKKHLESTVQVAELKGKHSSEPKQYESTSEERYLKVSPYGDQPHLLDMTTVSPPCQLLARALTEMQVIREDYATAVYQQAFSWPKVHEKLQELVAAETDGVWEEQSFYIVVFRSRLSPETDRTHLGDLDKRSHGEAMAGGGLLKYWFGKPDANGRNMATCKHFPDREIFHC